MSLCEISVFPFWDRAGVSVGDRGAKERKGSTGTAGDSESWESRLNLEWGLCIMCSG